MNAVEVIKEIIKIRKTTQTELAKQAGFKRQSNIAGILNCSKGGIRIGNLYQIAKALDCELILRGKTNPDEEWIITYSDKELEKMRQKTKNKSND